MNNSNFRQEIKEKVTGYLTAAFGLVAGLAWNDAVKALIDSFYPAENGGLIAKFIYAFGLTLILVLVTIYIVRLTGKKE